MTRRGWILLILAICACGPAAGPRSESAPPEQMGFENPGEVLHLAGRLSGAFPGLGPDVDLRAWIRADGRARLTIRGRDDNDRPTHEVLLWGPDSCLLFDATSGRFADLGDGTGRLEALGNRFELRDAVFLLTGRDPLFPGGVPTPLTGESTRFRGVRESGTLRREGDGAGIRWAAENGIIHDIAVSYDEFLETSWGPWPSRIEVTGTDLAAAGRLHWNELAPIVVLGDSIFDPLWEPASR